MRQEGLGADDKNGVYVCLRMLAELPAVKCAFFVGEEVGCVGSEAADMEFFEDCRFVIQCDRRGGRDFITMAGCTELCDENFIVDCGMENYGYKPTHGAMTDVMTLKDNGLGVSCVNLSCGYYNPHSDAEVTNIEELDNCVDFVRHICLTLTRVYPHVAERRYYGWGLREHWTHASRRNAEELYDDVLDYLWEHNSAELSEVQNKFHEERPAAVQEAYEHAKIYLYEGI